MEITEKTDPRRPNWFMPLSLEDIENKWQINKSDRGYNLLEFKKLLEHELHLLQRNILEKVYSKQMDGMFTMKIQEQNLKEQISYINNRILQEIINGCLS